MLPQPSAWPSTPAGTVPSIAAGRQIQHGRAPKSGVIGPGAVERTVYAVVADGATALLPKNLGGSFNVYTRVSAAMARRR